MLRWIRSRLQRTYELQFSPYYWILLQRWQVIRFWLGKHFFRVHHWLRSSRESISILRKEILQTIFGEVLLAILIVAGLAVLEFLLLAQGGAVTKLLPEPARLNSETYANILSTLAQIAGVFLGLYFTAVSIVASTVYARVPGDVRSLIIHEKVGNVYIRIVALLGAVATLLLAANALGFYTGILNFVLVTFLGIIAIFSFVVLGIRTFNFFDPTRLVKHLARDLMKWIRAATPAGFQWQNPSFQTHYQQQAESLLMTYRNIVYLANREEYQHLQEKSLTELGLSALGLLRLYTQEKSRIPSDSHWFKRTYRHRDWLATDYTQIDIALRTGTALQPEVVPNPMWFEAQVEEIVVRTMQTLLERDNLHSAVALGDGMQRTLGALAEHFAVEESLHLFRTIGPLIRAQVREVGIDISGSEDDAEQLSFALSLIDVYGLGLISIILSFSEQLRVTTADSFGDTISRIRRGRPKTVYATKLPRAVIEQLEYLRKGLEFEHEVECHTISPLWYQQQIAEFGFARFLSGAADGIVEELEDTFAKEAEALISEKRYIFAAQLIQRGLEACEKFTFHIEEAKACFDRLLALRRVTDIPWPTAEWDKLIKRMSAIRERLIIAFGQSSPALVTLPQSKHWPDYFGQAYSVLAQECYTAMATGHESLFQKIFPSLFLACLSAHDRRRTQLRDRDEKTLLVFSTEPIADILELSGYALIYTELDGKKYWAVAKKLWDNYFAQLPNSQDVVKYITNILDYRRSLFTILPRDLARTAWTQDLERQLRDCKLLEDMFSSPRLHGEDAGPQHPSAIIRALTRGGHIFDNPQDVFLVIYIMQRPEANELKLPQRAEFFADSLRREESGDVSEGGGLP